MKNILLGISSLMVALLIIALIYFQSSIEPRKPQENQITDTKDKQKVPIQFANQAIEYSLQYDYLKITFDKGETWKTVPIAKDKLFEGEYSGNKQELIEKSYILSKNRIAFLYSDGPDWSAKKIILKYSLDQGDHWQDAVVTEQYPSLRFRKVDFLNENFGYVILTGDRTVSQEMSNVYVTHDGGKSWKETNPTNVTRLIKDGGFVDEHTGFLSSGFINPEEPDLNVTQDGGDSWVSASIPIPDQYNKIFVTAELPFKEEDHLAVLINQGPSGDYQGGKVKGKFLSKDNGLTWEFSAEVQANETK
ncbi:WD40/YVTN/BNR-like repeat-containing protein [Neobacillus sp. NPDC093127]|uniref:WD40/YVTN/BNR-like repeat-containing protein n=1 Tax=Neobacillus sp. NPDC093127 TaxID=3364296 RepID=UPI00382EC731